MNPTTDQGKKMMKSELSRPLPCMGVILALLGTGALGSAEVLAGDHWRHDGKRIERREMVRDLDRHERDRRAFVAGAVVQQHREYQRDRYDYRREGYAGRYREYYGDDDRHDGSNVGSVLVGAAVGAVVTGVIMNNMNKDSGRTTTQP